MTDTLKKAPPASSTENASSTAHATSESLDKVRDILFGAQQRDADKRFSRMEERITIGLNELREEFRKRLDVLEQFIKKETQSLAERLKNETSQRADSDKAIRQELKDSNGELAAKLSQLDDRFVESQRTLREELLEQSKSLRDEARAGQVELQEIVARVMNELRSDKADRKHLAQLFNDMAVQLSLDEQTAVHKKQ